MMLLKRRARSTRIDDLAQASLSCFSERGFRNTQVSEIATRAGMSAGAVYLFAESKEDLFWLALRAAAKLPLDAGHREISAANLLEIFVDEATPLSLHRYRRGEISLPALTTVVEEQWEMTSHAARAIKLIERCAQDWPELAEAFYDSLRTNIVADLAAYLKDAAERKLCRELSHPEISARLVVETIAWFTVHRLGDRDGFSMDPHAAKTTTVDALVHAFLLPSCE